MSNPSLDRDLDNVDHEEDREGREENSESKNKERPVDTEGSNKMVGGPNSGP